MRLGSKYAFVRVISRCCIGAIAGFTVLSGALAPHVAADPAADALAKLNELSRLAEQTTEAMHSALSSTWNAKVGRAKRGGQEARGRPGGRRGREAERLSNTFQTAVNKLAAATYMGGRNRRQPNALSRPPTHPQQLIDKMALQRVLGTQMSIQMTSYRAAGEQAAKAEQASLGGPPPTPRTRPNKPLRFGRGCRKSRASCRSRSPSSSRRTSR